MQHASTRSAAPRIRWAPSSACRRQWFGITPRKFPNSGSPARQWSCSNTGWEAPLQFVAQIDPPPTHHPVHRGVGAGLDKLGQFGLLPHRQFRSGTWRFEIAKPGQSRGVVTVHPVPQGLTVHAAGFGRRFAVHAIEYQCKRKYPTRRRTILLPARRLAKLPSRQIKSGNRYRRPHRCRPLKSQHRVRVSLIWESLMSYSFGPLV